MSSRVREHVIKYHDDDDDSDMTIERTPTRLSDRMTLNLGCGVLPIDGAVNHDRITHSNAVDVAFDLDTIGGDRHLHWPIPDARFSKVIGLDVFEHLRADPHVWLGECWRILQDDGVLVIRVAAWDNPVSYRDPTHKRVFHDESFYYFDPRHELWQNYGRIYFPDGPWFHILDVTRGNSDYRTPDKGDICVVMRKVGKP